MKFPLSWIAQYADLPADQDAVARAYTLSGTEVEGRDTVDGEPVFDFNITVNRPDAMNVYGLAREASFLFGGPLKPVDASCAETGPPISDLTSVTVEAPDLCPRYTARVITGLRNGDSPAWMQERLIQCGLRPINAVADVTNFVLLELGHPLHAFDMDTLAQRRIVVRRAVRGEKMVTLDGAERVLATDHLVIADAVRPVALAGVMGGEHSGVSARTKDVLLEGAVFDPVSVRRTSKALGMHTDASHRFERGVDPEGAAKALDRCAKLILEVCGGTLAKGAIDVHHRPAEPRVVTLRHSRLEKLLGLSIPKERCASILSAQGFGLKEAGSGVWRVAVPSFRVDVAREADLIEEVVRVHGLDGLAYDLPPGVDPVGGRPRELEFEEALRDALAASGLTEAIHMSMTDPGICRVLDPGAEPVRLANPLAPATSVLRTSLAAPMLLAVSRNRARGVRSLALFELGKAYFQDGARPREERRAAALLYADEPPRRWCAPESADLLHLKGKLETALAKVGIRASFEPSQQPAFAPGLGLSVLAEGRVLGHLGTLSPAALDAAGVRSGTAHVAELVLEGLEALAAEPRFAPLSRFPAVVRDFSFLADKAVRWGDLRGALESLALPELADIRLVDCYDGKGVPEGQRSWTFSLTFQSPTRTLTEDDIAPVAQRVSGALREAYSAVLR